MAIQGNLEDQIDTHIQATGQLPDADRVSAFHNQAGAVLLYTAQVTNTGQFPPRFIEALSWKLAAELVSALTGEAALGQSALAMAEAALTLAKTHDGNEGLTVQEHDADWVRGREFLPLDGRVRQ